MSLLHRDSVQNKSFSSEKSHEKECVNKNLDVFMMCLGIAIVQCSYH